MTSEPFVRETMHTLSERTLAFDCGCIITTFEPEPGDRYLIPVRCSDAHEALLDEALAEFVEAINKTMDGIAAVVANLEALSQRPSRN